MSIRQILIAGVKLGLSGAAICAIAALFLVVNDDGKVPEAQADVADLMPRALAQYHGFDRVIERSGLQARPFDHNGNKVFFAAGESTLSPGELMDYYQRELVRAGVNSRAYDAPMVVPHVDDYLAQPEEEVSQRNHAMLNGEVIPVVVTDDLVQMAGMVPHVRTDKPEDLLHDWRKGPHGVPGIRENMRAYRFIEARRDQTTGTTSVVASWSDHYFDPNKAMDPDAIGVSVDPIVPSCIGCQRINRLEGLSAVDPFTLNQFKSTSSPDIINDYYHAAMTNRGWAPSRTTEILEALRDHVPELQAFDAYMLNFERDGEFINILVDGHPDSGSAITTITGEL